MQIQQILKPSVLWLYLINIFRYGTRTTHAIHTGCGNHFKNIATCQFIALCPESVPLFFLSLFIFIYETFIVIAIRTQLPAILIARHSHNLRYGEKQSCKIHSYAKTYASMYIHMYILMPKAHNALCKNHYPL